MALGIPLFKKSPYTLQQTRATHGILLVQKPTFEAFFIAQTRVCGEFRHRAGRNADASSMFLGGVFGEGCI